MLNAYLLNTVTLNGVLQQEPTLAPPTDHLILDGQYSVDTPEVNRVLVVGRDTTGAALYGQAADVAEIDLVGQRLDFIQDLSITSAAQAVNVASAVLTRMALTKRRAIITIPPNCGQELWDVVEIADRGANQQAARYRVTGIRLEYNPKQAIYQQRLTLGAP